MKEFQKYKKEISKLIVSIWYTDTYRVFEDFLYLSVVAIQNSLDFNQERENKYLKIINSYQKEDREKFPKILSLSIEAMQEWMGDFFWELFMELNLWNSYTGQYFTPFHVSEVMSRLTFKNDYKNILEKKWYISFHEPSCGSWGMIISSAKVMKEDGVNYQSSLLVNATDIDLKSVYMCYLHCTFYGIPAEITHWNTLTWEVFDTFHTLWYYKMLKIIKNIQREPGGISNGLKKEKFLELIK